MQIRPLSKILEELEQMLPEHLTQSSQRRILILRELTTHLVRLDNEIKGMRQEVNRDPF